MLQLSTGNSIQIAFTLFQMIYSSKVIALWHNRSTTQEIQIFFFLPLYSIPFSLSPFPPHLAITQLIIQSVSGSYTFFYDAVPRLLPFNERREKRKSTKNDWCLRSGVLPSEEFEGARRFLNQTRPLADGWWWRWTEVVASSPQVGNNFMKQLDGWWKKRGASMAT